MSRIKLTDNTFDVVSKMSEGNPGAMSALMDMLKNGKEIDPQGAMGGLGSVLLLDTLGIYGTDIYVLYNDQCNRNLRSLMMLLRAYQMGFLKEVTIKEIAGDQMRQFLLSEDEMNEFDLKVCEALESFQKKPEDKETK